MMELSKLLCLVTEILLILIIGVENMSIPEKISFVYNTCRKSTPEDSNGMEVFQQQIMPRLQGNHPKGFMGTVGIVGGHNRQAGSVYFAAIAALKMGADSVHIFCTIDSAVTIQTFNPNIIVHPMFNNNLAIMLAKLALMDIIVLGPGVDREAYSINVINQVITLCKTKQKPLIIDLDVYFWTANLPTQLVNYPKPGVIIMANLLEFDKIFTEMKVPSATNGEKTDINYKRFGENILIVRKGCSDMALSADKSSTWVLAEGGSPRRCSGQGDMLTGITATLFFWALRNVPTNASGAGPMLPAATASYSAAQLLRVTNELAFSEKNMNMVTSDMIDIMHVTVNDMF